VVVILIEADGTKHNELWRLWKWAWNVRGLKSETFMPVYGISPLGL
jgi:hypothetical protein